MSNVSFIEKLLDGVEVKYVSMGEIISRRRDKGKNSPEIKTVYSVSNMQGLVRAEDFRDNTIHSKDTSNYTIIRRGMFAYNPSRLNIGSIASLKDGPDGLVSPMYVVFSVDEKIVTTEYLNYFIKSSYCKNKINSLKEEGARFRFDFERWSLIDMPIPSIEAQAEIVRILDTFTELTTALITELNARKKQYNHYRDQLLSFEDDVPFAMLSDCCESISDGDHQAPPKVNSGIPFITISNVSSRNKIDFSNTKYVPQSYYDAIHDKRKARKNDVLYTVVGTFGIPILIDNDKPFAFQRHIAIMRPDQNEVLSKYLYHVLQSSELLKQANSVATGAAQKTITLRALNKMNIPKPPLEEQARIVTILDKFDALTNSITEGLPREIELRQKQYEYYRDLLLSFPKPDTEVAA